MANEIATGPHDYSLLILPIFAVFGFIAWQMIFFETYRHFPKMDKSERIGLSFTNTTIMTIMLGIVVYISLQVLQGYIFK